MAASQFPVLNQSFLWTVQRKSRFRWVDGTTEEFLSCTFRFVNSTSAYWPNRLGKYLWLLTHKLRPRQLRRNWETAPLPCLSFFTWAGLEHLMCFLCWHTTTVWATYRFSSTSCSNMVKLGGASFKRLKRHLNQWEKGLNFQVWEVANHWNATSKRFMKKLGSLPSRTDEISFLYVSPKSNCLTKMAQNSRLWCQRELWIETLQRFFGAQAFNTTHCHVVRCQCRRWRDSLVKGRWRVGERPLAWELETFVKKLFKSCDY